MIRLAPRHSGPPYVGTCALAPEVVRAELGVERVTDERAICPRCGSILSVVTWTCDRCGYEDRGPEGLDMNCFVDRLQRNLVRAICPGPESVEQPVDHRAEGDERLLRPDQCPAIIGRHEFGSDGTCVNCRARLDRLPPWVAEELRGEG